MRFSKCHEQMFLGEILTTACLLIATMARVNGEVTRKSRSINVHSHQPVRNYRLNSLSYEKRDDNRHRTSSDTTFERNYRLRTSDDNDSREFHDEEEKLFEVIMSKNYRVSTPLEIEKFDRIGERMIERANITEEAKRVVRQVKRQRPGFFWTLARVAFETVNETRSAIEQISLLVGDIFAPEVTTLRGSAMSDLTKNTATTETNSIETTTEEEDFKFTPTELQSLIRRNLQGLVRLFNIEWRDALNQSRTNVRDFQRDLGNRISPFLKDNPDVV